MVFRCRAETGSSVGAARPGFSKLAALGALTLILLGIPLRATNKCTAPEFKVETSLTTGAEPVAVAVGDFNRDGQRDLAVVNSGSDDLSIFLGDGHGKFSPPTMVSVGKAPRAVASGDINGDGHVDLVVANSGSNSLSTLVGNGGGRF